MTQDEQNAMKYNYFIAKGKKIVKVEEARMPEWTDTYGRKWKIEIKKGNGNEHHQNSRKVSRNL